MDRLCIQCGRRTALLPLVNPLYCSERCGLRRAVALEELCWCEHHSQWGFKLLGCQRCRQERRDAPVHAARCRRGPGNPTGIKNAGTEDDDS